jgi:LysM repeat protein
MRSYFLLVLSILFVNNSFSQKGPLMVEGTLPNIYLSHKVIAKENYYSIGRLYNVQPKELATYNKLNLEKGLSIGVSIKIPLKENFTQQPSVDTSEALVPLYHVVLPKETLSKISVSFKLPPATLKKLNNLKTDAVTNGSKLIVGYLKVIKSQSAFAKSGIKAVPPVITLKSDTVIKKTDKKEKGKKKEPVKDDVVKDTTKPIVFKSGEFETHGDTVRTSVNFDGGLFKKLYEEQSKGKTEVKESGNSGVFKTTSGWQDGKYYCFHNNAPQGTIIKVTNNATGKSIYAKVLDILPDIKQNEGLVLQLSNAAAEQLGVSGNRFDCSISYYK